MKSLDWIRDLVEAERKMEETGMIDLAGLNDDSRDLELKTYEFLKQLKETFVESVTAFNNMKNSTVGGVKIYGISNTVADFMLFRNGYKLLFAAESPGQILMTFQPHATPFMNPPGATAAQGATDERLDAKHGPFGEMTWTYRGVAINPEYMVRYYLSKFVRESSK